MVKGEERAPEVPKARNVSPSTLFFPICVKGNCGQNEVGAEGGGEMNCHSDVPK